MCGTGTYSKQLYACPTAQWLNFGNTLNQKIMLTRFLALSIVGVFFACGLSAQQGEALSRSLIHGDTTRTYIIYVPQAYTGGEAWPLIISLHGYTGTADLQRLISNFEALADEEHFLVAYPQGLEIDDPAGGVLPLLPPRGNGWNILDAYGPDDLGFMAALIDSVAVEFNIDAGRVYAAGHSNGGALAYALACEPSSRVAAIASVGGPGTAPGLVPFFDCNASGPVPILHIHGTQDGVVPYTGTAGLFASIPATVEGWGAFNGCTAGPVVTEVPNISSADGSTVTLIQYLACDADAEVWHFRVNGGGHWWPGSIEVPTFLESVFGRTNRDLDASREIWNFFSGQPLTGMDNQLSAREAISLKVSPNPFQDELTLAFGLPEPALARLVIYDQLGRPVAVLPGQYLPQGEQQLQWNLPGHLAAGLYLLVAEINGVPAGRVKLARS